MIDRIKNWILTISDNDVVEDISDEKSIYDKIVELEKRLIKLEEENIGTTNELYELQIVLDSCLKIISNYMEKKDNV
jgi:hypothetical protein